MHYSTLQDGERISFDKIRRLARDPSRKVHFIGVGGVSMYSLAMLTMKRGAKVSGSDRESGEHTEKLQLSGATIFTEHRAENLQGVDLVVFSHAISDDNPELFEAERLKIPAVSRAEYLGALMLDYSKRIGVSGTHGKSSTVAMLDTIFLGSGVFPTVLSGADLPIGEPIRFGSNGLLIYEACEYKDSFLRFSPSISVGLNLEMDHPDYFSDTSQLRESFRRALGRASSLALLSGDDENLLEVRKNLGTKALTFGRSEGCDYRYSVVSYTDEGYIFSLSRFGSEIGRFSLNIPGEYNVHNATAAIVTALEYGLDVGGVADAIASYRGIPRRLEHIGSRFGRLVFYDYAHHPTEIAASINALKSYMRMPITVIFKPHTYSRTKALWKELCQALSLADHLILLDIYPAREQPIDQISSERLAEEIKDAIYSSNDDILFKLDFQTRGGIVLMGAGDFKDIKDEIVNNY